MITSVLIGSGVSYYSGMPKLDEITSAISLCENISKHTDLNYYLQGYLDWNVPEYSKQSLILNKSLIEKIKFNISEFYKFIGSQHVVNYEDIYYVLKQINDSYILDFENPVTINLIRDLLQSEEFDKGNFKEIVKETLRIIECVVWQMIDKGISLTYQFSVIKEIQKELSLENLISLNHDLVLDKFLDENAIQYFDGFKSNPNGIEEWIGFTDVKGGKINYYKLHGSVNWFDFYKSDNGSQLIKVPDNTYAESVKEIDN